MPSSASAARLAIGGVIIAAVVALLLAGSRASALVPPLWVNDYEYGSVGEGFYWDAQSGQVWTAERGWHMFAPQPPRAVTPLWVNDYDYPSAGQGFYLDPHARMVWTAECGWHRYDHAGCDTRSTFGDGVRLVGSEVVPGATYRTRSLPDSGCYWARLSGFSGDLDDIIANDFTAGYSVVTIGATDAGFESSRCGTWTRDLSPITASPVAPVASDGVYIVGVDIAPGLWRAENTDGCYWARLSGFSGDLDDIIANDFLDGTAIVEIQPSDVGFETSRCSTWTKIG